MYVDRGHRGQVISTLKSLDEKRLNEVLETHGFPSDAKADIRQDNREALIKARLHELLHGERQFMQEREVTLPTQESADVIADSDVSDED